MKRKKLRLTPKQAEHMLFNVLEIGSRMLVSGAEAVSYTHLTLPTT